jgi:hypothetical protein
MSAAARFQRPSRPRTRTRFRLPAADVAFQQPGHFIRSWAEIVSACSAR